MTWSAQSALVAGWTLQAQLHPEDLLGRSSRASGLETPITGSLLSGAWHRVGDTGPPYGILLSAQNANLVADDLSRTSLEATIVDAHNRPIASDHAPTVTFSMLSGPAFIEGPMAVQTIDGRAMTQLRAGNSTGTARVLASAPGLRGDTLKVVLRAGSVAALELSADPPSIHLDETDRAELTALLRDARGNAIDRSGDRVQFSLGGLGTFPAGLAAVDADNGVARSVVTAAEPGTLRVQARIGDAFGQLDIPVINTQPPYLTLSANRLSMPADGSTSLQLTATLRDPRGQLLVEDHSTPVRFSLVSGHALLNANEVITRNGQAGIELRALGIAGPIVVQAEAANMQTAEIQLHATAAAPHRVDLVALPSSIVADRNATAVISAVIRDSLGNIVYDSDLDIRFSVDDASQSGSSLGGEILNPAFALTANGRAGTVLQTTGGPGKILVFAGASGLAPATFEIPVYQAVPPQFTAALDSLKLVEDGPAVQLALGDLVSDGDSDRDDLSFAVSTDSAQVHLEIVDGALVATPVTPDFWGEIAATITMRDPTGLETSVPLSIAVQSRNDPPHITSTPDTVIAADVHFVCQLTATDADADALTYRLLEGPRGLAFDQALQRAV